MDLVWSLTICSCAVIGVVIFAWRILNYVWLKPKRLEKVLRQQGFNGNPYKFLFGDMKDMREMRKMAYSKPINLSDDILPRANPIFHNTIQKYGKASFVWFGPKPTVYITEPDDIKEVLNKYNQYQKPSGGNPLSKLLSTGLFDAEGERWVKHRKIINPAFHLEKLKNMLPAMYLSASEVVSKWETMVMAKGGQCELDVLHGLETFTSDVISRTAFGSSYEEGRRIFQLQKEQADLLMQAVQNIYIPGMRYLPTKTNKRMNEIDKEVKAALRCIVNKRMRGMEAGESSHDDLLGILLDSNSKEIKQHGSTKFGMTIDEVMEECKLFYFAGQETTSNLLAWTMILLSQHPYWQMRAREEVLSAFGNNKPEIDGLNHLKVVNMILLEVLRLYPPAVTLARDSSEDIKLAKTTLPAGVMLHLPIIMFHHDRQIWGDDAKEFNPERFSEGVLKATNGKVVYFPFSSGPRICIGQNFAMLEAKMAMAMILQRFSFRLSPSYTHAPHTIVTLQPQHGAHLILQQMG